jgi:hypothetical protein
MELVMLLSLMLISPMLISPMLISPMLISPMLISPMLIITGVQQATPDSTEQHTLRIDASGIVNTPAIELKNDEKLYLSIEQLGKKVTIRVYFNGKEVFNNGEYGIFKDVDLTFTDAGKYIIEFINIDPLRSQSIIYCIRIEKEGIYSREIILA